MRVIKVLCVSTDGGARKSIMGLEDKSIFRIYFYFSEVISVPASSWQKSNVINLLPSGRPPGGVVPYRKLGVGLRYWQIDTQQ